MTVEHKVISEVVRTPLRTELAGLAMSGLTLGIRQLRHPRNIVRAAREVLLVDGRAAKAITNIVVKGQLGIVEPNILDDDLHHPQTPRGYRLRALRTYEEHLHEDPVMVSNDIDAIMRRFDSWSLLVDLIERPNGLGEGKPWFERITDFTYVMANAGIIHRPDSEEGQEEQISQDIWKPAIILKFTEAARGRFEGSLKVDDYVRPPHMADVIPIQPQGKTPTHSNNS